MIMKEQLKADIDTIDEQYLVALQQIINLFKLQWIKQDSFPQINHTNPLKNSITFETDVLSPIDERWSTEQ